MTGEDTPTPDAVAGEKPTPSSGVAGAGAGAAAVAGGGDAFGGMGGAENSDNNSNSSVLSTMSRVGCAAKVVQIGRVAGSDSFKVTVGCSCPSLVVDRSIVVFYVLVLVLMYLIVVVVEAVYLQSLRSG